MKLGAFLLAALLVTFPLRAQTPAPTASAPTSVPFASPSGAPTSESVASLPADAKLNPRTQPIFAASNSAMGSAQLIFYFLLLAVLVAGGLYLIRRGLPLRTVRQGEQRLQILETKMLGNRQFLLVVAYDDARMLLGVSPGKVEFLTALDTEMPETAEMINLAATPTKLPTGEQSA